MRASPQHIYMHENDQLHVQTNLTPWKQLMVSFKWLRPTPIWRQWCLPSHRSLPSWFLQKRISKNCICVCALFLVGFCRLPQPQKSFRKCKVRGNKETKKCRGGIPYQSNFPVRTYYALFFCQMQILYIEPLYWSRGRCRNTLRPGRLEFDSFFDVSSFSRDDGHAFFEGFEPASKVFPQTAEINE